jgi:hypothetical protein
MSADRPVEGPKGGYTDREMRLIFERAGQLDVESGADRRFSLAELKEMGAQAGLDPADISTAAAAIRAEPPRSGLLGAPTRFTAVGHTRRRLGEAAVVEVVQRIREVTAYHGDLKAVPGGMEWRVRNPLGVTIVDFSTKREGTRIDVLVAREDRAAVVVLGSGVGGLLVGLGTAMVAGLALHSGAAVSVAVGAAAGVGTAWGAARLIWAGVSRRIKAQTSSLLQTITDAIETSDADPKPPEEP